MITKFKRMKDHPIILSYAELQHFRKNMRINLGKDADEVCKVVQLVSPEPEPDPEPKRINFREFL